MKTPPYLVLLSRHFALYRLGLRKPALISDNEKKRRRERLLTVIGNIEACFDIKFNSRDVLGIIWDFQAEHMVYGYSRLRGLYLMHKALTVQDMAEAIHIAYPRVLPSVDTLLVLPHKEELFYNSRIRL